MDRNLLALLVEADRGRSARISAQLQAHGFRVIDATSIADANVKLDQLLPDLAIVALELPDGDGLSLLSHPALESTRDLILTADEDDPERVRHGMLAGAGYFFCHPADQRFLDQLFADLAAEQVQGKSPDSDKLPLDQFGLLRGSSPLMHKLYRALRKVSPSKAGVYLVGESGTGKHLIAQSIHELSTRAGNPFVSLNCSAAAPEKMEKELFGQETVNGATPIQPGCLERAEGGTLFLNEITEMPRDIQVRLLEALETGRYCRVGGRVEQATDVRIVAASTREPDEAIQSQDLREDFFLRISGLCLHIPPLRMRGEDVPGLALYFLRQFNEETNQDKFLTPDAAAVLDTYSWPGNVRELRSFVEQAYILAEHEITPEHFPALRGHSPGVGADVLQLNIGDSVQDAEKKLTLATLTFYKGDKRKAAQTLGVSLKTLYNRINAYQADKAYQRNKNGFDGGKRASAD